MLIALYPLFIRLMAFQPGVLDEPEDGEEGVDETASDSGFYLDSKRELRFVDPALDYFQSADKPKAEETISNFTGYLLVKEKGSYYGLFQCRQLSSC